MSLLATSNFRKILLLSVLAVYLNSCNNVEADSLPTAIIVQPLEGIKEEYINHVLVELRKIYPKVILNEPIAFPGSAFYAPRNRYRADSLIKFLLSITPNGHRTIALTDKDISTTKGNISDYGIMGLGYQPGRSCVVSSFRLAKENLKPQLFKVSVHELGHTQGLPHCSVKTCLMRDAEGKNHLNEETGFCNECKEYLNKAGWHLK